MGDRVLIVRTTGDLTVEEARDAMFAELGPACEDVEVSIGTEKEPE